MWETPFKSGELLMEQTPSQPETLVGGTPLLLSILVTVFVILALLELRNFLHVAPFLWDSVFRARGSVALENNVRVARERNQLTLILMIPAILFIYRYRLYDASFVQRLTDDWRLVRRSIEKPLKPRRRADNFRVAHRAGYTFFILLMLLAIAGVTILYFFRANDFIIKSFLYILSGIAYLVFLIRKTQILSISCNPLLTFLYLCGLEILPTGALIATAVLL